MRPAQAVRQLFVVLEFQAFLDESRSNFPDGEFVLAGHIAPAEKWAAFAREWELLLPTATQAKNGAYHFKMSELAMSPDGMDRAKPFYSLIEKYVTVSISHRMNLQDFRNAHARIDELCAQLFLTGDFAGFKNPYFFSFRSLIDNFPRYREAAAEEIPLTEKVDFYFDDLTEKKPILEAWDGYLQNSSELLRDYYGNMPRFENDQRFLPLQAADLWAWWVRRWYEEDSYEIPDKMSDLDFGKWRGKPRPMHVLSVTEDQIFERLKEVMFDNIGNAHHQGKPIFPVDAE